ncbi:Nucleic acid-binding protein [Corchorus olitorius]|uniref:Nucleic acid-binding protein n=1 Tax=Corchorus olitorius TaxID=93759 RepID=A0A1R3KN88_9ROSI|nr:Nucleic acid-binding protein [Corchorus olitorius]
MLSQLRDGGQRGAIVIRMVHLWDSIIPPNNIFTGIDFLAVDYQGFAMHGTIPADLADDFRDQVREDKVYKVQIFEGSIRSPLYYFKFASYEEIMAQNEKLFYMTATDVKSVVRHNNRGTVDKREIILLLTTGQKIKITVWDPKIVELDITAIIELGYKPVLAIGGVFIKDNQAYKQINTCSGTKFLLDPNIPEGLDTRKHIPLDKTPVELLSSSDVENLRDYTYPDAKDREIEDLLYMNAATTKGVKFRVKGKVIKFQTKQGWFYNSCQDCTYGVKKEASGYTCPTHGDTSSRMRFFYFDPIGPNEDVSNVGKGKSMGSSSKDQLQNAQSDVRSNVLDQTPKDKHLDSDGAPLDGQIEISLTPSI